MVARTGSLCSRAHVATRTRFSIALVGVIALPLACGKQPASESGAPGPSALPSSSSAGAPEPSAQPSASVVGAGPSASVPPAPAGSAAAPEKARAVQRQGEVGQFFTRARALELTDEQKTKLDAIDERLWGAPKEDETTKGALGEFFAALLEGVKAGRIVDTKLQPHYAALEAQAKVRHESEAMALNELHDILDANQRKLLVDGLEKKYPSAADKAAKPKKPAPPPDKARAAERSKRRTARVAALLGLDDKQQIRVEPILTRFDTGPINKAHKEQVDKRMRALLAAFEKEEFDALKLDLGKGPKARMAERVSFVATLLAILKADQRAKLARTLERPTAKRWGAAIVGEVGPTGDE